MPVKKSNSNSQSTIEYVAIIIMLIAVFIAMAGYYKRAIQGKYREAGDVIGAGAQYEVNVVK